jgi:hypothetical protein
VAALLGVALLFAAGIGRSGTDAAEGYTWGTFWLGSSPWTGGSTGPIDGNGNAWYEPDYDASSYLLITIPDVDSITAAGTDRFYRNTLNISDVNSLPLLSFQSNDSLSLYVNGVLVGSYGNGYGSPGCVNLSAYCATNVNAAPISTSVHTCRTGRTRWWQESTIRVLDRHTSISSS